MVVEKDFVRPKTGAQPPTRARVRSLSARVWERAVRRRVALTDAGAVAITLTVAYVLRFEQIGLGGAATLHVRDEYVLISVVMFLTWLAALRFGEAHDPKLMGTDPHEYLRVTNITLAYFGAVAVVAYLLRYDLARGYVAIAMPLGLVLLNVGRLVHRRLLETERRSGRHITRALVVGGRDSVTQLVDELGRDSRVVLETVAACVPGGAIGPYEEVRGVPVVGDVPDAAERARALGADAVIVTSCDMVTPRSVKRLAWDLESVGADLILAPALTDVAGPRVRTRPVAGLPLMHVEAPGYTGPQLVVKRTFDLVGAAALLVVLAVPLAVIALAVLLASPGPVLFAQERIGLGGRPFTMYKFRSMVPDAEARLESIRILDEGNGLLFKMKEDPRVTRVGRFLRRYSLDELPQLFNVLTGSMSLVGPRPQLPREVAMHDGEIGRRLLVRPGLTGLWQVKGRSDLSLEESKRLDLYYVENWSPLVDISILLKTFRAVVSRRGAY